MLKVSWVLTAVALAVLLALGACSIESPREAGANVAGRYASEENSSNYLELRTDGTFYLSEDSLEIDGTYELRGSEIILALPLGLSSKATIRGDTLIDDDGERWSRASSGPARSETSTSKEAESLAQGPVGGFSVDIQEIVRNERTADIRFVITKVAHQETPDTAEAPTLRVVLTDDHANSYSGTLTLDIGGAPPEIPPLIPLGFSYRDKVIISIPESAPIVSIQLGSTSPTSLDDLEMAGPQLPARSSGVLPLGDGFRIGEYISAVTANPEGDVIGWSLPLTLHNTDYLVAPLQVQIGVQLQDGTLVWKEVTEVQVPGSNELVLGLRLMAPSEALVGWRPKALIVYLANLRGGQRSIGLVSVNTSDFGLIPERFVIQGGFQQTIYLSHIDGSGTVTLVGGTKPAWSADGTRIAYRRSDGVYLQNADGQGEVMLVGRDYYYPIWLHDGSRIAVSDRDNTYVVNVDGSTLNKVGPRGLLSPDGSTLLISNRTRYIYWPNQGLVVEKIDGSGQAQVATGDVADATWSPGGEWIAYIRGADLVVIRPDGSNERKIATEVRGGPTSGERPYAIPPAWSPDGSKIVFAKRHGGIYVVDREGSGEQRIDFEKLRYISHVAWAPALRLTETGVVPVGLPSTDSTSSVDETTIARIGEKVYNFFTTLPPPPDYLLDPTSFDRAVSTVWATFAKWTNQVELTESYKDLYYLGLHLDGLSRDAGIRAKRALNEADWSRAEELLEWALRFRLLSQQAFSAAATVFDGQLEVGQQLAEGIKDASQASVRFGLKFVNPLGAVAADYVYMATDYGVDSTLSGADEANRNLLIRLMVRQLTQDVPFEHLGGVTFAEYAKQVTSDRLRPVLEQLLQSEEARQVTTQVLAELVAQGLRKVTERTAQDLLDQMLEYVGGVEVGNP